MDAPNVKFQLIYDIISDDKNILSVSDLCDIANVSRSGYYHWVNTASLRNAREAADRADFELILDAYNYRSYKKGARGIQMRLLHLEPPFQMNVKKIRRLMKKYNLFYPIRKANPYRRMAKALRTNNVADNLLQREFTKHGPRFVLLTDITYIPFDGHFFYLSTEQCPHNTPQ